MVSACRFMLKYLGLTNAQEKQARLFSYESHTYVCKKIYFRKFIEIPIYLKSYIEQIF